MKTRRLSCTGARTVINANQYFDVLAHLVQSTFRGVVLCFSRLRNWIVVAQNEGDMNTPVHISSYYDSRYVLRTQSIKPHTGNDLVCG